MPPMPLSTKIRLFLKLGYGICILTLQKGGHRLCVGKSFSSGRSEIDQWCEGYGLSMLMWFSLRMTNNFNVF